MSCLYLSLLCPAFATKTSSKSPDLIEICTSNMGIDIGENAEFFRLVKFDPNTFDDNSEFTEVAVRLK